MRNAAVHPAGKVPKKVCLVSSPGGHLSQIVELREVYQQEEYWFIIEKHSGPLPEICLGRADFLVEARRGWNNIVQTLQVLRLFLRRRPEVVISCGAACAVAAGIVSRLLGIRFVYVETISAMQRPSLAGRICYRLAHSFYIQWPELKRFYPEANYAGNIFGFCISR